MNDRRLTWGLTLGLALLYMTGLVLGWGDRAPWHLLLVIVAILFLYSAFNLRGRGS